MVQDIYYQLNLFCCYLTGIVPDNRPDTRLVLPDKSLQVDLFNRAAGDLHHCLNAVVHRQFKGWCRYLRFAYNSFRRYLYVDEGE